MMLPWSGVRRQYACSMIRDAIPATMPASMATPQSTQSTTECSGRARVPKTKDSTTSQTDNQAPGDAAT